MRRDHQRFVLRGIVIGLGAMGANHLRVLGELEGAEVVAVVDPDPAPRELAQRGRPGLRAHADLETALAAENLDFACVVTPHALLAPTAHTALAGGLHVLVEKPTAHDEDAARELVADADRRGLVLGVGHVERFNPAVVALKQKLDDGLVGGILQMHARRLSPYPNRAAMRGASVDLATHDIDIMRYLCDGEVERVFAETTRVIEAHTDDLLCATLRFDTQATGLLEVNWLTPTKVRQLSVTGERGMLVVDYLTQELAFFEHPTSSTSWDVLAGMRGGGEGDMIRYALDRKEPLRAEWEGFLGAVGAGRPAPVTGRDGLAALSTAVAIQRSGTTHETVRPAYRSAGPVATS